MPEPEFKITIKRILAGVEESIASLYVEIKDVITELQSQMDVRAARMNEAEQRISDMEDKLMENNEAEKKRETKAKQYD